MFIAPSGPRRPHTLDDVRKSTFSCSRALAAAFLCTACLISLAPGETLGQGSRNRESNQNRGAGPGQGNGSGGGNGTPDNRYHIELRAVRSIDGTNSSGTADAGAANTPLVRISPADYPDDGSGETIIVSPDRANPRTISNRIVAQGDQVIPNNRGLSDFLWAWGQFLDHDIDLTHTSGENGSADIPIEDPDDILGPFPIPFNRSDYVDGTGTPGTPREHVNAITSFIDASNVYGSEELMNNAVRSFEGGQLLTSDGNLPPLDPNSGMFICGDVRANENVVLSTMHTLFLREHNRIAHLLGLLDPEASDDDIFELTRKIIAAEMQLITYQEFLPALLGDDAPGLDEMFYDPHVDPSIANEFSTAFYRVGHTMLSSSITLAEEGQSVGAIALRDAFFNPTLLTTDPNNVDRLLGGLVLNPCQEIDNMIIDDVRNFLFGPPGSGGLDLASLNIQRGRDHGLPDYNTLRAAYGLPRVNDVTEITSDADVQTALTELYDNVDNIDAWVGALAEDHVPGGSLGPLMSVALRDQFQRVFAGDKYNLLNDSDLMQPAVQAVIFLPEVTLANVVRANTTAASLPTNAFHVEGTVTADVIASYDPESNRVFLTGNQSDNHVLLIDTGFALTVIGLRGTRINGDATVQLDTRNRPHITADFGAGNDSLMTLLVDFGDMLVSLGDGDDSCRSLGTTARQAVIDPGTGTDQVTPPVETDKQSGELANAEE